MRHSLIAASLLLATSAPVLAQNLDALRDGLNHLPATVLGEQNGALAYFVDIEAVEALGAGDSQLRPYFRLMPTADIKALDALARLDQADWEAKAGVASEKLRYVMGYGLQPNGVSMWGLADEAAATDMIATLETLGFENAGVPGVVGNGEPMNMDPSKVDAEDPWRTQIGAAQFATAFGTNVVQAPTPQAALVAASQQPRLGENEIFGTALAGLEQAVGEGQVVQALVISPLFGVGGLDPAALISSSADMEATRNKIEEQMAALGEGIPAYLGGIVADLEGERQGLGIALAYPDCGIAQTAAEAVEARWAEMAPEDAQGEVATETVEGSDGLCAAAITVEINADNAEINQAYRAVLEPFMRRQPGVLQIGES